MTESMATYRLCGIFHSAHTRILSENAIYISHPHTLSLHNPGLAGALCNPPHHQRSATIEIELSTPSPIDP